MNFIEEFKKGQSGSNKGLPLGPGLSAVTQAINGTAMGRYVIIASPPKVGKTTYVNYSYVASPYIYALENNIEIEWIYYSLEMTRLDQEFNFAVYFLFYDFGITEVELPPGVLKRGCSKVALSVDYLRGRLMDDNYEVIKVNADIFEKLKIVYATRIIPLFGEFSKEGVQIKEGLITVIENSNNPTGTYKELLHFAEKRGVLHKKKYGEGERLVGYTPTNPNKYVIVIQDHMRKVVLERGYDERTTINKLSEYFVMLRNLLNWTFVGIIHLNRSLNDLDRFKQFGDKLFPDSDMIKSSGSLSEDADYVFTLFNPNDERYNLKKHFGIEIKDMYNNLLYPNYRSIHLVESRHCAYPQHFAVNMIGSYKNFENFKEIKK